MVSRALLAAKGSRHAPGRREAVWTPQADRPPPVRPQPLINAVLNVLVRGRCHACLEALS